MLYVPARGHGALEDNVGAASAEFGSTVTAGGVAHTKNATYSQLIAALAYDSYGITIALAGTGTVASTNARMLVDIAIGGVGSERVIIPNLMAGNVATWVALSGAANMYFFPIFIPRGVRLSATAQALIVSDTCTCAVWLNQKPAGRQSWVGSRVASYGVNLATSSGVSHSPGNGAYAAATEIIAACTYPIHALQFGYDLLTDTTALTSRGLARIGIGATPDYIAEDLPFQEITSLETVAQVWGNMILSQMIFDIPAATRLAISAQRNIAGEARGWIIYGVD